MYGSFEDFARYANDREMDTFGTQEFFDYHNAKRDEAAVPADTAQPVETSIAPTSEGVNIAARDTGVVSDAPTLIETFGNLPGGIWGWKPGDMNDFYGSKLVSHLTAGKEPVPKEPVPKEPVPYVHEHPLRDPVEEARERLKRLPVTKTYISEGKIGSLKEGYKRAVVDGLVAINWFSNEQAAHDFADKLIGAEGRIGLGDIEPLAVSTGGLQSIRRGIDTGDKSDVAWGVVDVLTAGIPFYGKAAAKAARSVIEGITAKFGKRTDVYHGPRVEYGAPQISELAKYKGADAQGFGFYVTPDPVQALGHSHTFNVKHSSMLNRAIPTLLDRVAPLDQQGKGVLEKLERGLRKVPPDHPFAIALNAVKSGDGYNSVRGSQFYNKLSEEFGKQVPGDAGDKRRVGQQLASEYLGSLGIPGASEGRGKMFIIWDQKLLDKMKWGKSQPDIDKALLTPGGLIRPGYNKPAGKTAATKGKEDK